MSICYPACGCDCRALSEDTLPKSARCCAQSLRALSPRRTGHTYACVPVSHLLKPLRRCAQPLLSKHEATIDRHLAEMRTTATDFASLHFNKCGPTRCQSDNLASALVDRQSAVVLLLVG